ncbi:MAG: polyphosphate kinase 2, partial [Conchiformibius sp.]|nr:polyphosphate kinase 2 [Conchiformibius sp.]
MSEHQLQPFEQIDLGEQKGSLAIFEQAVLEYKGRVSKEDSGSAPLPADYPYKTRMSRREYEKEKKKLQVELLKVQ